MIRRPPRSTPFPYTPLFRSAERLGETYHQALRTFGRKLDSTAGNESSGEVPRRAGVLKPLQHGRPLKRSEEHTSELQSRQYLVCRLLLEKKKKIIIRNSVE